MVKIEKGYFFRVDWKEEQIKASSDSQVCLWGKTPRAFSLHRKRSRTGDMWKWPVLVKLRPGWSLSQLWLSFCSLALREAVWSLHDDRFCSSTWSRHHPTIPYLGRALFCEILAFLESKVAGVSGQCCISVKGIDTKWGRDVSFFSLDLVRLRLSEE